jgi:large subunit GTPase 1
MGRQGGQGKGKPKLKDRALGKSLVNQINGVKKVAKATERLNSILDNSALDDFIITAEMDETDVEVVRVHDQHAYLLEPTTKKFQSMDYSQMYDHEQIHIPRKPAWTRDMTAEEIDRNEKNVFLSWRRNISLAESADETRKVTPYEKNIQVWRQLWRVLEKCDFAVQIVDARNPLLYYTRDLLKYAKELNPPRPVILLINKADFLTENQRRHWAKYFDEKNIAFVFYSARDEQEVIDSSSTNVGVSKEIDAHTIQQLAENILRCWRYNSSIKDSETTKKINQSVNANEIKSSPINNSDDSEQSGYEEDDNDEDYDDMDDEEDEDEHEDILDDDNDDIEDDVDISELVEVSEGELEELGANLSNIKVAEVVTISEQSNERKNSEDKKVTSVGESSTRSEYMQSPSHGINLAKVLKRSELIKIFEVLPSVLGIIPQERHGNRVCVGMVGYPNVGKSSVINTILGVSKSTHGIVT